MIIKEAIVVDNNDPDKTGKVKIRIMPEMASFTTETLPWCNIYTTEAGFSSAFGKHIVLENNALIRVLVEDHHFKKIRYISDDIVEGLYFYDSALDSLSEITELSSQTYPQPMFHFYKDGTIEFHNSTTGEHGTYYKGGGYTLVDSSGNVFVNLNSGKIKVYNTTSTLKEILVDIQSILLGLVTPLNITDSRGGPCTYLNASTDFPKIQQVLTKLNGLMED